MKKIIGIVLVITLLTISVCVYATATNDDAIITLGYFNKQLESFKTEITQLIDNKIKSINSGNTSGSDNASAYEIVTVTSGKKVIFGESTEFIIRRGTAIIIDPSNSNGIPNLTTGKDDSNNGQAGLQNLYLVPRDDGRGILAKTDLTIMVRGKYEIK